MEGLKERMAYLKGLAQGLEVDESTKEGKLLLQVINILEGITETVSILEEDYDELYDYIEAIDQDLTDMENDFYEEPFDYEDEREGFSMECPECSEVVFIDDDALEEEDVEILCPRCHSVVFVQGDAWEDDDEEEYDENIEDGD